MSQLATRTDVAVAVRVESQALVDTGGVSSISGVAQQTVLVAWRCGCVCFRLSLGLVGLVLAFLGMLAELLGPALRAAGTAAIEASKGDCDCVR